MKASGLALNFALVLTAPIPAAADVLLLDAIGKAPPNNQAGLPRPERGASKHSVQARFGEPQSKQAPVGQPPIARWVYPGYTVYFEYDHVIDTVVHR